VYKPQGLVVVVMKVVAAVMFLVAVAGESVRRAVPGAVGWLAGG